MVAQNSLLKLLVGCYLMLFKLLGLTYERLVTMPLCPGSSTADILGGEATSWTGDFSRRD